jgi:hypothetical protein
MSLCDYFIFSFRRINHLVLHHLHRSSVKMQAEYHISNNLDTFWCNSVPLFHEYSNKHVEWSLGVRDVRGAYAAGHPSPLFS